jgi:hypothetical protein
MGKADSEKEGQWERRKVWKRPVGKKVSGNTEHWERGTVYIAAVGRETLDRGLVGKRQSGQEAEIHKNGTENGWFPALINLKIPKTLFFAQKYLIKYTPKIFLRNTLIFKIFEI